MRSFHFDKTKARFKIDIIPIHELIFAAKMNDIDSVSSDGGGGAGGDGGAAGVNGGGGVREIEIGQALRRPFAAPPSSRSRGPPMKPATSASRPPPVSRALFSRPPPRPLKETPMPPQPPPGWLSPPPTVPPSPEPKRYLTSLTLSLNAILHWSPLYCFTDNAR